MADLPFDRLRSYIAETLQDIKPKNTRLVIKDLDVFQRESDREYKQVTFRIEIASYEKTLREAEVNKLLDELAKTAKENLSAERI